MARWLIWKWDFGMGLAQKVCIRKPDLGIICKNNPVQLSAEDCTYKGTFDLCIKALLDSNKKNIQRDIVVKKRIRRGRYH